MLLNLGGKILFHSQGWNQQYRNTRQNSLMSTLSHFKQTLKNVNII